MNRLADETSPYLLQHADNPVDWYPWGEEAFERARSEDRPILLSVGYSACHWCHVMERESFANPETAAVMNENFVCIKVDREERPDIDSIYMDAVMGLTGSGGWPLTAFLTPAAEPFAGGTYFPPVARDRMPAFRDVLRGISEAWRDEERRPRIQETATKVIGHLREGARRPPAEGDLGEAAMAHAYEMLVRSFDYEWGSWGRAPKFPLSTAIEYLARRNDWRMVEKTLDSMAAGGMYDLVGGGFHRYAVDERWLIPHFEKMLYDNAQLAVAYLHGWRVIGKERYGQVVEETIEYMLRELALDDGGFASSQDADTEGVEGKTFTWTRSDGVPDEMLHFFEGGRFVLRGTLDPELRAELLATRQERAQPARDDKAVTSWNGLTLAALAECGRTLDRPEWIDAGRRLGELLLGSLSSVDGRLHRTWRGGVAKGYGYLDDYANVAHGLIELHVATGELRWLEEANRLARLAVELFADEEHGGFFDTPVDGEELIARKKHLDDNPTPSGNAMLAYVLLRLSCLYGDDVLEAHARRALHLVKDAVTSAAPSFGWSLVALDLLFAPHRQLAIVGGPESDVARAALAAWEPRSVVAFGPSEGVPLLAGKTLVDGKPAVYVCERFACQAPITDAAAIQTA